MSETSGERPPATAEEGSPGLIDLRRRIERLADGGRFRVVCSRTGETPVPAVGLRFPDRRSAAVAARLTGAYRAVLRRRDPTTTRYDPVVCEGAAVDRGRPPGRDA